MPSRRIQHFLRKVSAIPRPGDLTRFCSFPEVPAYLIDFLERARYKPWVAEANGGVVGFENSCYAGVAQLVEQQFRKLRVGGAIPLASFLFFKITIKGTRLTRFLKWI